MMILLLTQINVTISPEPLLLALGVVAVLVALFVAAASGDVYAALLWYQSPKIWVVVSVVSRFDWLYNIVLS